VDFGTWNIISLIGKGTHLINEMKKMEVKYMVITETKKEGQR
jgi:hypothetical protein